jgi:uncharacterized membrane protein
VTTIDPPTAVSGAAASPDPASTDTASARRRDIPRRAVARVADEGAPLAVVAACALVYVVVFGWLTYQQQRNYSTFGFDMGIHDQGIWLLSRFEDPYVTVVGRDYFGHHLNLVALFYVPFYWLGAGPAFLYFSETVVLALGAVPVYLIARDQLGARWLGTAFAAAYLLHPSIQWINWWHFHPDALMITPLLFAWWYAINERWRAFGICCVLAMFAKEDAATAVVMLGVVLLVRHWRTDKRVGLYTIFGGLAWFFVATKVLMPYFNNGEPAFYEGFFEGLGGSMGEIVRNAIRHPSRVYDPLLGRSTASGSRQPGEVETFREEVYRYYVRLLVPMCIFALRKPMLLLVAMPMLVINVLSTKLPGTHDAKFHYSSIIIVAVVIATIEGCKAVGNRDRRFTYGAVAVVLAFAFVTNTMWSPSPLNDETHHSGVWSRPWLEDAPRGTPARDHMVALVPSDAGVSATYALIPHLTHRKIAYEFPNPWWSTNWLDCKTTPRPERVDMLVIDTAVLGTARNGKFGMSPQELFDELTDPADGEFAVVGEEGGIVDAERVRPAELTFDNTRPECE